MGSPFFRQAWIMTAVWLNMFSQGIILGYTSCLLTVLRNPESNIKADLHTASWVVSSCAIAAAPGVLLSAYVMDVYGRKLAHLLFMVPGTLGWVVIYFAQNLNGILIGRILGGVTIGSTTMLGAIVVGEYSSPKYRGVFLNLKTAAVCLGSTSVHILDHLVTWRTIALLTIIPHVIVILIVFTWPETPPWLASKGRFENSKKAFFWLRGKSEASSEEIEELIKAQMKILSEPTEKKCTIDKALDILTVFTKKDFLKPMSVVIIGFIVLESSGRHIFPAYALQIVGAMSGNQTNSFYFTLAIDLIITASTVSSSILVKVMKRRRLLFSTGFTAFAVLMLVCTYLTLIDNNDRSWIAVGSFVVYFILANLGCTPIPLALIGEIIPLRYRGVGSAFSGILMSALVLAALQITPYLLHYFKVQGTFFVYGVTMGLALLALYFLLPETKDRTLQEIEYYFNNGRYRDDTINEDDDSKVKKIDREKDIKMFKNNSSIGLFS